MGWFRNLFSSPKPALPAPRPAPKWLDFDGERLDLNTLDAEQKSKLAAVLRLRQQQRENELTDHLLTLAVERERLLLQADPGLWLMTLQLMFGEALGRRVAVQDVGVGMQLQHLIMAYGRPDHVQTGPAGVVLTYGQGPGASVFEVEGDVISRVVPGTVPPLPLGFWPT